MNNTKNDTKNNTKNRVLGRVLARELALEEMALVSGGRAPGNGQTHYLAGTGAPGHSGPVFGDLTIDGTNPYL